MKTMKGYYSLIQFCPDASRLEAVNVGVLLFCPEAKFIAARTAKSNGRAKKLVERGTLDIASLNSAKRALERRLEIDRESFQTLSDLQRFVDTRANALTLTVARPIKVMDPEQDLGKLFEELVGGDARRPQIEPALPALHTFFQDLQQQGRARLDWEVTVPVVERPLKVPYAYKNGVWNLIKPQHFSVDEGRTLGTAMRLAIEGDLLFQHKDEDQTRRQLIVVGLFEEGAAEANLQERVHDVLAAYNVTTVPETELGPFLQRVKLEAHP